MGYEGIKCQYGANHAHRPMSNLWTPQSLNTCPDKPYIKTRDCEYMMGLEKYKMSSSDKLSEFVLSVSQSDCKRFGALKGGSTFDIFATTSRSLVDCSYVDSNDDTYHVSCKVPTVDGSKPMEPTCIQVTAVLYHEHYDTYGEVLYEMFRKEYYPLRYVVADNRTFCSGDTTASSPAGSAFPLSDGASYQLATNQAWFSGH